MNKRQVFCLHLLLLILKLFLELWQTSVLELRRFVQIIFSLRLLDVLVDLLDLLPDPLDAFHRCFLILPLHLLACIFFLQSRKLFLKMFQTFPA